MLAVRSEDGSWWIVGEVTGSSLAGPFYSEEDAWEWMDEHADDDGGQDDGRDFTPPYEP